MFEFEYDALSEEQINACLRRIGWEGETEHTIECLSALIGQFQSTLPFDNQDICYGHLRSLDLSREHLFEKIVEGQRGGVCFEMNSLLLMLLRGLGFDAYLCICRVASGRTELANLTHCAVIVRLDGKQYYCDVGYGGPAASFAVELSESRQTVHDETYWIEDTCEGWRLLMRMDSEGNKAPVIVFLPAAVLQKDRLLLSDYLFGNPENFFASKPVMNIRTKSGHKSLTGNVFTRVDAVRCSERLLRDSEIENVLHDEFRVDYKGRELRE